MKRRRSRQYEEEDTIELSETLEPYQKQEWLEENSFEDEAGDETYQPAASETYLNEYQDYYGEEYSEEHEMADNEGRFHLAMGMFDLISIVIGIAVILVLVSMLITLFNWLRNDILHSALLLQSGLQ